LGFEEEVPRSEQPPLTAEERRLQEKLEEPDSALAAEGVEQPVGGVDFPSLTIIENMENAINAAKEEGDPHKAEEARQALDAYITSFGYETSANRDVLHLPEIIGLDNIVQFLGEQGIEEKSSANSDYSISELPLDKLSAEDVNLLAGYMGLDGSQPGIPLEDMLEQIGILQEYWELNNLEMLAVMREVYYADALDNFIAGASEFSIPDLRGEFVTADGTKISQAEAAFALSVLLLGRSLEGYLNPSDPALGLRGSLVPVYFGKQESGIDHVIAGLSGFLSPGKNANDDLQVNDGDVLTILKMLGSTNIDAVEALTWEGDLGSVVLETLKNGGFDAGYAISMPPQDFEGDILATIMISEGLIDPDGSNLINALQAVYDPDGPYYSQRYELFAKAVLLPLAGGIDSNSTLSDIIDPDTGMIDSDIREAFIEDHVDNVQNYGTGLLGREVKDMVIPESLSDVIPTIKKLLELFTRKNQPLEYAEGLDNGRDIAVAALNRFLDMLAEAIQQGSNAIE